MADSTLTAEDVATFWSQVDKTDSCWNWTAGMIGEGYGWFRRQYAHRISYSLAHGHLPALVDHSCLNPRCVNPDHLRAATRKQNGENLAGAHRDSATGIRGVSWSKQKKKWRGDVCHNGKRYFVGMFTEIADAEAAVIAKRNELFTHNDKDRLSA